MVKFGTSGFRAIIGDEFTKLNVQKIAQSIAKKIKKENLKPEVVIGYDRRFMSDVSAGWMAEVLAGNKIKVKLFSSPVPSPAVMYAVMSENLDFGLIVTASHNPYMYNGVKVVVNGGADASVEVTTEIEKMANSNIKIATTDLKNAKASGLIVDYDNIKDYIKFIHKFMSKNFKENNLKVVFDAMHGATADYADLLAKSFKLKKFELINDSIDPYFEHKLPAPENEGLDKLKKEVVKGRFNIGVAVDGDGDRLGVVDENGEYYDNNTILAIIYYYLGVVRGLKGDVVKNLGTSDILKKLAETMGQTCYDVPVGFKYVSAKMKETGAIFGGEGSGGLTMKGYIPSKDSFFSISLLLDAMVNIGKPLSAIVKMVKEYCGYISTYIEGSTKIGNKKRLQKVLRRKVPNFSYKPTNIIYDDGTKYFFEGGNWVLIRFSGTEDILRYYLEFSTEIECERNIKALENFIKQYGA